MSITEKEMRDSYYIMRAMHDGACPSCGHLGEPEQFVVQGFCLMCPECNFSMTAKEIRGIEKVTAEVLKQRLESFDACREELARMSEE
tara:strand:+ start:1502 stop:1765 length:264 start_codon:yes stop_codon:yes gene_type:complete